MLISGASLGHFGFADAESGINDSLPNGGGGSSNPIDAGASSDPYAYTAPTSLTPAGDVVSTPSPSMSNQNPGTTPLSTPAATNGAGGGINWGQILNTAVSTIGQAAPGIVGIVTGHGGQPTPIVKAPAKPPVPKGSVAIPGVGNVSTTALILGAAGLAAGIYLYKKGKLGKA